MSDSFDRWINLLASHYSLNIDKQKNGYRLKARSNEGIKFIGSRRPVLLSQLPKSKNSWDNRLQLIEKAAAQAMISAPVGFCCTIRKQEAHKDEKKNVTVLRLAFGLSLTHGLSIRQRFTAYYVRQWNKSFHIVGEDQLFTCDCVLTRLNLKSQMVKTGLKHLLDEVQKIQEIYSKSDAVISELDKLREGLSSELRNLDRLYTLNYGKYAKLLGRAFEKLRGEDAIETEYVNRMEDIFNRFQPAIFFEPLTFSVIYCQVEIFNSLISHQSNFHS